MAITNVTRNWKDVPGARLEGDPSGLRESGSASMFYLVEFDTADDFEDRELMSLTARYGSIQIPNLWEPHRYNPWWYVKSKFSSPYHSPTIWLVEVQYEYNPNPLSQPVLYEWDFVVTQEATGYGYKVTLQNPIPDGSQVDAIVNSAGEPMDPPLMRDCYDLVVRVRRNTASYSALLAKEYCGAVNSDSIWQHPPLTVRCNYWKASMQRAGALSYFEENLEFQFRYDLTERGTYMGWWKRLVDMGFRIKGPNDPIGQELLDADGNPISSPAPLDGQGGLLMPGQPYQYRTYLLNKVKRFSDVFNF